MKLIKILKVGFLCLLLLFTGKIFYASSIDASLGGIKAELITDGTAPFDNEEGDAKDSSATNQIIRSYDEATYDFTLALNGTDTSRTYDVEVIATLPDINTSDRLKLRWLTSNFDASDIESFKQGSEIKFYIRNLRPGQIYTKSLVLETKSIDNGFKINPHFKAKIVGDLDSNSVECNADKELTVSAKTNLDVDLKYSSTMSMQEIDGKVGRVVPFAVDLKSKGITENKGRGNAFPEGDIELIMRLNTTKVDIQTKEESPVDLDTSPIGTLTVGGNDKFKNQIRIGSGIGSGPTTSNPTHVSDGGKVIFEEIEPNVYRLVIKDYKITNHFPRLHWGASSAETSNPNSRSWSESYRYFASHVFEIFVPLIEGNDRSYDIRAKLDIVEINFTDSEGNHTMDSYTSNNTRTIVVPDYINGSYSIHNYTQGPNGETLDRPLWSGGNARILQSGGRGRIQPYVSFSGHTSALEGIKGGVQMVTFIQGDKIRLTSNFDHYLSNANHNPVKSYKRYYGVGKLTPEQIVDPNTDPNLLTWYTSFEEAQAHENPSQGIYIYGVASDCRDNIWATGGPQLYQILYFKVRKENTQPFERVFSKSRAYIYRDEERKDMVTINNSYVPSEYDENGDIMPGTHIPSSNSGGATFQLIPYEAHISTVSKNIEGKSQTSFDLSKGNEILWEINGNLSGLTESVDDEITIKHIIPKGHNYKVGSANIEPFSSETLDNGNLVLTWKFNGYDPGVGIPKIIFYTQVPIATSDRTNFVHKTTIHADGDRRSESEFRTATNQITIVNDASMRINKSVNKNLVELGEEFTYTVSLANNSKRDYTGGTLIDVLPYNGDTTGSNFRGSYKVTGINLPRGVTAKYTAQDPNTINRNPNNSGVSSWSDYTGGEVNATALLFEYETVAKHSEYPVQITVKPTGNERNNIYMNQAHGSIVGLDFAIYSNVLKTEVIARDITGSVWSDDNKNGINNESGENAEQQIANIEVELLGTNNKVISRTTTDSNGKYIFRNILPGEYSIRFIDNTGGMKPTKVLVPPQDDSNHISNGNLTSSKFLLTSTDRIKTVNLGVVNGVKLVKNMDKQIANVGEEITYTLKTTNQGGFNVNEVTVFDELPQGLELVPGSISNNGTYNSSEHKITWTLDDLAPSEERNLKFKAIIKPGAIGKILNVASVKAHQSIPESPSNETELTILTYEKRSSVPTNQVLKEGQEYTYYIDVTNDSNTTATGVLIEDTVSNKLSVVENSISNNGSLNKLNNKITWTIDVPAKSTSTVSFKVKPKRPNATLEDIVNVASVNGNATNEVINKVGRPVLDVNKSVNKTKVREGDKITYTIEVRNTGGIESETVELTDIIPSGASLTNGGDANISEGVLRWNLGKVQPNQTITKTFEISANELPQNEIKGNIINVASILERNLGTINSNEVTTQVVKPRLEFEKEVSNTDLLTVGDEITYTITVRNTGTASEKNVIVTDTLPTHTELVEILDNGTSSNNEIRWDLGELPNGEERSVRFKVRTTQKDNDTKWSISNAATVNNVKTNTVVNEVAIPHLAYSKSVDKTDATVGDILTYTIEVTNDGDYTAYDVDIEDTVPEGTTSSVEPRWVIDELAPGDTERVSFKVTVSALKDNKVESIISNKALVNGNETNEVQTTIRIPKLEISKSSSVEQDDVLKIGDEIEYSIVIENVGSLSAYNVKVLDSIPRYTELKDDGNFRRRLFKSEVTKTIDEIAPKERVTLSFKVTVKDNTDLNPKDDNKWNIINIATVNNEQTNEVINKVARPLISIKKAVNKTSALEKDILKYTLEISNKGDIDTEEISVSDIIPQGTHYVIDSANESGVLQGDKVNWTLDNLNSNETKSLTFKVKVDNLFEGTLESLITNTATLEHTDGKGKETITSNEVETRITKPLLIHNKTVDKTEDITVGDILTYNIEVRNEGTSPAYNVKILDSVPTGTELVEGDTSKTISELGVNETSTMKFKVRVLPDDLKRTSWEIRNTASVNKEETNEVKSTVTTPKLEIEKSVNRKDLLTLDDYLQYDIKVTNTGNNVAKSFSVTDVLPKHLEILETSHKDKVVISENTITWNDTNLKPGKSETYSILVKTVWLNGTLDKFENIASVELKDIGVAEVINSNKVINEIAIPKLKVEKRSITEEKELEQFDEITYEIKVENVGNYVAKNVKILDEVPVGLKLEKGDSNANLGDLKPGESKTHKFTTSINKLEPNVYTKEFLNKATITSDNHETVETNETQNIVTKGDLRFTKTSNIPYDSEVRINDEILYYITLENIGDRAIPNVIIKDTLDDKLTYVTSTGDYNEEQRSVFRHYSSIGPKQKVTLEIKAKVNATEGEILNKALVSQNDDDFKPTNSVKHRIIHPSLTIEKFSEKPSNSIVLANEEIKYTLRITNNGTGSTVDGKLFNLSDLIPEGTSLVKINNEGVLNKDTNTITWNLPVIEPNGSYEVDFVVKVNDVEDRDITNTATLNYDSETQTSNETVHYLRHDNLIFSKSVNKPRMIKTSDDLLYTIKVSNEGTTILNDIEIKDEIPKETDLIEINNEGQLSENTIAWSIDTLEPKKTVEVSFLVKPKDNLDDGTNIVNRALVNNMKTNRTVNEIYSETIEIPPLSPPKEDIKLPSLPELEELLPPIVKETLDKVLPKTGSLSNNLVLASSVLVPSIGVYFVVKRKRK